MPELEAFFHDLRALRAGAGLSLAELAGLAHFPQETLAAAEAGPALPPNPVLVAYVQACGGPVGPWEDRWRDASAAAASGFPAEAPEPAGAPQPAAPRGRPGRRAAVAVAAAAVTMVAAGAAVALTRPAAHTDAAARPRTSPNVSRHHTSRPRSLPRRAAAAPPRMTSVLRVTGVGCPASQDNGVTATTARPGPPWTAAAGHAAKGPGMPGGGHAPPAPPGHNSAVAASAAATACSG